MSKTIDFDAYRKEKKGEGIKIKAFGKTYELPPSPRMAIMEKLMELRQQSGGAETIPEEELVVMIRELIGEKESKELYKKGVTLEEMEWLLKQIWSVYGQKRAEGSDSKNPHSTSPKSGD